MPANHTKIPCKTCKIPCGKLLSGAGQRRPSWQPLNTETSGCDPSSTSCAQRRKLCTARYASDIFSIWGGAALLENRLLLPWDCYVLSLLLQCAEPASMSPAQDVKPGKARVIKCLMENMAQVGNRASDIDIIVLAHVKGIIVLTWHRG